MSDPDPRPVFRFAPSPNGRLHRGHAYSALLNADLAARRGGRLLLRIEDIDPARSRPDLIDAILTDLAWLGLTFEAPVRRQSEHMPAYRAALETLIAQGLAYPCFCTRGTIRAATVRAARCDPDGSPLYPGTCRALDPGEAAERATRAPHAWRLDMAKALAHAPGPHLYRALDPSEVEISTGSDHTNMSPDSAMESSRGSLSQGERAEVRGVRHPASSHPSPQPSPARERGPATQIFDAASVVTADPARWGDAVIARRDIPTSYHLAVVVDDAAQGVTHVVRGRDLAAATDLHVLIQALLGRPTPRYHHHALILGPDGGKLAKSKGSETLADLRAAGATSASIRTRSGFA